MKNFLKIFGIGCVIFVLMFLISFAGTGGDLAIYKFWAPKKENARRQVFEKTQSYVDGKIEYIGQLEQQYNDASSDGAKDSLRVLIISEASTVDDSLLPVNQQLFIQALKENKGE